MLLEHANAITYLAEGSLEDLPQGCGLVSGCLAVSAEDAVMDVVLQGAADPSPGDATEADMAPKTVIVKAADATGPKWKTVDQTEFDSIWVKHQCARPVTTSGKRAAEAALAQGRQVNVLRWLWVRTIRPSGRLKSRLVLDGSRDLERDLVQKSSPTIGRQSLRIAVWSICHRGWALQSGDVPTAFLRQDPALWDREVYAYMPKGYGYGMVRLLKAVYGLACGPYQWYLTLRQWLLNGGFRASM